MTPAPQLARGLLQPRGCYDNGHRGSRITVVLSPGGMGVKDMAGGPHQSQFTRLRSGVLAAVLAVTIATCAFLTSACAAEVEPKSSPTPASTDVTFRSDKYGVEVTYPTGLLHEIELPDGIFLPEQTPVVGLASDVQFEDVGMPTCFFAIAVNDSPPDNQILTANRTDLLEISRYAMAQVMGAQQEGSDFDSHYVKLGGLRGYVVRYTLNNLWETRWYHLYRETGTVDIHTNFPLYIQLPEGMDEADIPRGQMKKVIASFRGW